MGGREGTHARQGVAGARKGGRRGAGRFANRPYTGQGTHGRTRGHPHEAGGDGCAQGRTQGHPQGMPLHRAGSEGSQNTPRDASTPLHSAQHDKVGGVGKVCNGSWNLRILSLALRVNRMPDLSILSTLRWRAAGHGLLPATAEQGVHEIQKFQASSGVSFCCTAVCLGSDQYQAPGPPRTPGSLTRVQMTLQATRARRRVPLEMPRRVASRSIATAGLGPSARARTRNDCAARTFAPWSRVGSARALMWAGKTAPVLQSTQHPQSGWPASA